MRDPYASPGARCVLSVAEHAGWAYLVCVAGADRGSGEPAARVVPVVVDRRRVPLIDSGVPTQPYHHESLRMPPADADALIRRVRQSVEACAAAALLEVTTGLMPAYLPVALAIRQSPFPGLPDSVAEVRQSYRLQCAADGMLYQEALCRAARDRRLDLYVYARGQEVVLAARALGVPPEAVVAYVSGPGRPSGPPWTADHRRACVAGIAALARLLPSRLQLTPQ